MTQTLRKLFELALTHVSTFAFPLVFAVLCGRVLGVHNFGVVSFYTALAAFLGVIVEFGFDWLGIREVAQSKDQPVQRNRVLWNVTAAKLMVCVAVCVPVCGALLWSRGVAQAWMAAATLSYMLGFALDTSWYLRALEHTRLLLAATFTTRLAGIGVLWLSVVRSDDMAAALWSYTFVSVANALVCWAVILRGGLATPVRPEFGYIVSLLRRAVAILMGNLGGALLTNGGIALLGLSAAPATLGAANLALRVKMAGQAILLPINQLSFVRLAALAETNRPQALRIARLSLVALMAGACVIGLSIAFGAEWIVRQVFRTEVPVATGLIMLTGLSIPISVAGNLFGMQSLVAFSHERSYALVVAAGAVMFSVLLVSLRGDFVYGWSLVAAETAVTLMAGLRLRTVLKA